jgi:DNA-binding NarL/FixJ family response regulator
MHNEPQIVRRALSAGATGYLTKDNDPAILLAAVRRVAAGGRFIDPALAESLAFDVGGPNNGTGHEHLSDREFQILCMLALGKSVNEIAIELSISNKTVSTHKARLMEKMNFTTNADLVRYAVDKGLII